MQVAGGNDGHRDGFAADPEKVKALQQYPQPFNVSDIPKVIPKVIPNFADVALHRRISFNKSGPYSSGQRSIKKHLKIFNAALAALRFKPTTFLSYHSS